MFKVLLFNESKLNFIDDDNNFVGFDNTDDCCAHGGWFISDTEKNEVPENYTNVITEYPDYHFDKNFFKEISIGEGGMVIFQLRGYGKKNKFLHLFNQHNGYYSRGFTAKVGGTVIEGGI